MPVTLENLTSRPLVLTLPGGDVVRLSPHGRSPAVPDVEVDRNAELEDLAARGVLALHGQSKRATAEAGGSATSGKGGRKK